jgi:hypothetical protein
VNGLLPVTKETWIKLRAQKHKRPRNVRVLPPESVYAKAYANVYDDDNPAPALMQSLGDLFVKAGVKYSHRLGC